MKTSQFATPNWSEDYRMRTGRSRRIAASFAVFGRTSAVRTGKKAKLAPIFLIAGWAALVHSKSGPPSLLGTEFSIVSAEFIAASFD